MKSVEPKLANQLVKVVGFKHIRDCDKVISREDIENALKKIEPKFLEELGHLYRNRVGERVLKGVRDHKQFMCLIRRVLKRHNVLVTYKKRYKKRKAYFTYQLVC